MFTGVTATASGYRLRWMQEGEAVDEYRLSYSYNIKGCDYGRVQGSVLIPSGNARSYDLTDLHENSDYTISLAAIRNNRAAVSNNTIHFTTNSTGEDNYCIFGERPCFRY